MSEIYPVFSVSELRVCLITQHQKQKSRKYVNNVVHTHK